MSVIRQIGINVITQWIVFVISGAIGVLLVPFLIVHLGRDQYGLAMLMGVIVSFATIADLGLSSALGRHLSEALAKGEKGRYSELVSTAFLIWTFSALVVGGLLFVLADSIAQSLDLEPTLVSVATILIRTFGLLSLFFAFIKPVFSAILLSHNRFDLISRTAGVSVVLNGGGLYFTLGFLGGGIYTWAIVSLIVNLVVLLCLGWFAFRLTPNLRISPWLASRGSFNELFSFGWQVFLLRLTDLFSVKADPIILTKFLGPGALAVYQPGLTLTGKFQPLVMVLANQLLPVTTRYQAKADQRSQEQVLFLGTRVTFSLAIGAFVLLGGLSESITRLWLEKTLGADYRIAGYILIGWAAIQLIKGSGGSVWPILMAKNRIRFWVYLQVPLTVVNVAASVYLVGFTEVGIVGVILPTICIMFLIRIITFFYICRVFEMTALRYLREAYARPILVLILFSFFVGSLQILFPAQSLFDLVWLAVFSGVAWAVLFLTLAFRWTELGMLIDKFRGRRCED